MTQLYHFDEQGYQVLNTVGAAGSVGVAPGEIAEGKVARWNGEAWEETDPPAASVGGISSVSMEDLAQALDYDPVTGALVTITAGPTASGVSYVKTFTYVNGRLSTISEWVVVEPEPEE